MEYSKELLDEMPIERLEAIRQFCEHRISKYESNSRSWRNYNEIRYVVSNELDERLNNIFIF